jgi:UDP-N-acetylglucosamine/UDP-N-acetylgalactosamine diphosphorylase
MQRMPHASLLETLNQFDQGHVLLWWQELTAEEQSRLTGQLSLVDYAQLKALTSGAMTEEPAESPDEKARRAVSPSRIVRLPKTPKEHADWQQAADKGNELLAQGKVGAILVAGGQGTRLGFPHPKGMLPIGPVSGHSLFQILAEQLLARSKIAGAKIPYYIMTSDATHAETVDYFEQHNHFGLPEEDVHFFKQGNMPAVEAATGRILLAGKCELCLSPNGHGGLLFALRDAGLIEDMKQRGIEHLHYHQVDNPTAKVCDPAFLGFHALRNSDLSTKVVAKRSAEEKMGVLVEVDGRTQIIEYSDMPEDVTNQMENGQLRFWAGNTAMHAFRREFLEELLADKLSLPFHRAHKKVPYWHESGRLVEPDQPNAWKFERFIFDALPKARLALVVEANRAEEFHPVKNAEGHDSPAEVREAMRRIYRSWMESLPQNRPAFGEVEISPLYALDQAAFQKRFQEEGTSKAGCFLT